MNNNNYIKYYQNQLKQGDIQKAYHLLMDFIKSLHSHYGKVYPKSVSNIYQGKMDITFFSILPPKFKKEKLKVVLVYLHEELRFDVWLTGVNKGIQKHYWTIFKESDWDKFRIPKSTKGVFSIVEHTLVDNPNFDDLQGLRNEIITEINAFMEVIEKDLML